MLQEDQRTTTPELLRFDRPTQSRLGTRTAGDRAMENPEAADAIVDCVQDGIFRRVDAAAVGGH